MLCPKYVGSNKISNRLTTKIKQKTWSKIWSKKRFGQKQLLQR